MQFKKVTLYSSNLAAQRDFYTQVLGFDCISYSTEELVLQTGKTLLEFRYRSETTIYHFAFNIPSNQGAEALDWLKERVEILDFEGDELVEFDFWNAQAMYFYDADGNILEYIARRNLKANSTTPFSGNSVLEISEVGLSTTSLETIYNKIQEQFAIPIFSGSLDRFAALGNEHALFIVIDRAQKKWIPRDEEAHYSPFMVAIEFEEKDYQIIYENAVLTAKAISN